MTVKNREYTFKGPISIETLVIICKELQGKNRKESIEIGDKFGITRHDVESIRQMLGYSRDIKIKTPEEREQIVQEYLDGGISMNALARKHGVHYNSIRSLMVTRDVIITTSKRWTVRQEKFLIDGLNRKKPISQIADEMGKSKRSLFEKIKRMGLK